VKAQESNKQLFHLRLNWTLGLVVVLFLVLASRLWQLQVIQGPEYVRLAEQNRVRTIQLVAPRGTISDRNNVPLVENRSAFNILLYRESIKDMEATTQYVVEKLGVKPEDLAVKMRRGKVAGLYRPVVVKEDVSIDDISVVEAHKRQHPEIQLGPEPRRHYRHGSLAAHVLGYVGEVSEDEILREAFPGTAPGDLVGKSGVERVYNQNLTGTDGKREVLVTSVGREVGFLDEMEAQVGGELQLTLDFDLQEAAEKLLAGKVGTIVAMDPTNGEILAMASAPSFDPNSFSTRISEQDWNQLINDPNRPLQNRSIQNSYPPGSTFKLFMAAAGLEEGMISESTHVYCSGSGVFYNHLFHCHKKEGHGTVGLEQSIIKSCNIFFYELGRRLGIDKIAGHALELGLGERTGIDLPGERNGVVPTPEWKQQTRGAKWFAGETISVSIGQGSISVTPLQLLRGVSAIATNGRLTKPHVLLRVEHPNDETPSDWKVLQLPVAADTFKRIKDGMWGSVNNSGTGHNAAIPGVDICGKTGTVQVIGNDRRKEMKKDLAIEDHSWFVGFGSRDNPEIAVVAFLEHGGMGGIAAAPLAREIFSIFYAKKQRRETAHPDVTQLSEARP